MSKAGCIQCMDLADKLNINEPSNFCNNNGAHKRQVGMLQCAPICGDGMNMHAHSVNVCKARCHEVDELHVCFMDSPPSSTYNRLLQPAAAAEGAW